MASQASGFPAIRFSITTPFKHVRLMEVPDEILEIITSKEKNGTVPKLTFKSSPPPNDTKTLSGNFSATKSKDSVLHLCSDDKIWAVKQVSTSNSVYILQPTTTNNDSEAQPLNEIVHVKDGEDENMTDRAQIAQAVRGTVSAIAQVGNFLELQPIKIVEEEIKQMILQLLPIYDPPEITDSNPLHHEELKEHVLAHVLENDIPAPVTVIRKICSRLCMIDRPSDSSCRIPSAAALYHTWSKIIEGCSIESVALDQAIDLDRIINVLSEPIDQIIAKSMLDRGGMFDELQLTNTAPSSSDPKLHSRNLKPLEMSLFIAILILKYRAQLSSSPHQIVAATFIEEWTALVSTSFVKYCTVENLTNRNLVSTSTDIDGNEIMMWPEELVSSDFILDKSIIDTDSAASTREIPVKSAATGKRKWHEKFAAQRAAKK